MIRKLKVSVIVRWSADILPRSCHPASVWHSRFSRNRLRRISKSTLPCCALFHLSVEFHVLLLRSDSLAELLWIVHKSLQSSLLRHYSVLWIRKYKLISIPILPTHLSFATISLFGVILKIINVGDASYWWYSICTLSRTWSCFPTLSTQGMTLRIIFSPYWCVIIYE